MKFESFKNTADGDAFYHNCYMFDPNNKLKIQEENEYQKHTYNLSNGIMCSIVLCMVYLCSFIHGVFFRQDKDSFARYSYCWVLAFEFSTIQYSRKKIYFYLKMDLHSNDFVSDLS